MDDSKTTDWMLFSDKSPEAPNVTVLRVQCRNNKTAVYVATDHVLASSDVYEHTPIRIRVDSQPPIADKWSRSTDAKAAFAPQGGSLLYSLKGRKSLLVEFRIAGAGTGLSRFDLSGLDSVGRDIASACGWHWE